MVAKDEAMKTGGVATGADHRRHERLRLDTTVKYKVINRQAVEQVAGPTNGLRVDGIAKNISLSGLAITTETQLGKGDYLKVELSLPGMGRPTRALAEVMWSRVEEGQKLAGIRFLILLNEADDSSIRRFMEGQQGRGE
jgi:hypothetical protein